MLSATDNNFTFTTTVAASATTNNVSRANIQFNIASGGTLNVAALGWGIGVYNAGVSITGARAWNRPATANADSLTLPLRQWGLDNFGEDLLALPKQGRLYVWDEWEEQVIKL